LDFNYLLTQRMNIYIRDNLSKAIQKFESSPITHVLELESFIENIRTVHFAISKYLNMDSFNSIFNEVNESISLVSFEGRITSHIIEEVILDLFPTYIFNAFTQRFVKGPPVPGKEDLPHERDKPLKIPLWFLWGTKPLGTSYANINEQFKSFVGYEHLYCITRLVSRASISLVIDTCMAFIEGLVVSDLGPYISALIGALPPSIRLQPPAYQLLGVYQYFIALFKDFIAYPELRSGVFHGYRSMGNCLAFLLMLDQCQIQKNVRTIMSISPFVGIMPHSKSTKLKRQTDMENNIEGDIANLLNSIEDPEKIPILQALTIVSEIDSKEKKN